ncbi:alpha/beta hydrolase [Winogradskyella sp.]|uniref:alpha/beta fold hydrolase n=1 Tax=Winogradskyella sp. TaxID=1883156 RepID=UPI00345A8EF8
MKEALISYIKKKDFDVLTIIGHSMGGNLAVEIAAEYPNIVKKLVIVDALACMREVMMPGVPEESITYKSGYNNQMLNMEDDQFKAMVTNVAIGMTDDKDKQKEIVQWILEADRKTYVYGYTDLLKLDLRPKLSKIKAKSLVLVAPSYGPMALETMENQYKKLNNKTVKLAPKGKHFIMFDNQDWFCDILNSFLINEN